MKSDIPVINITTLIQERINTLKKIYYQCMISRNIPIYLWNIGWGYFKCIKSNQAEEVVFIDVDYLNLQTNNDDIFSAFNVIYNYNKDGIFILENLSSLIQEKSYNKEINSNKIVSQLTNIYYDLQKSNQSKFLLNLITDDTKLPEFLSKIIPTIVIELPTSEEIINLLKEILSIELSSDFNYSRLLNAVSGLTLEEIGKGLKIAKNIGEKSDIDSICQYLIEYKKNCFSNLKLNFVSEPKVTEFGGLDLLKQYFNRVKTNFSPEARAASFPLPKGCLLVGPPGTGKTLAANVSAKILGLPIISVDTGIISGVNASYLKTLLQRVEACSPVVLYFDELDKLFDTSNVAGNNINSQQILGTLLTWLQDKKTRVFAIATLNRIDLLPPELTRAGRFDEIFYVGFPQAIERKEILTIYLAQYDKRYRKKTSLLSEKEWKLLLNKTLHCTGAELATIVGKAAQELFHQKREIKIGLSELLKQREAMVPLYIRDTDRILAIENRAKYVAQPASSIDTSEFVPLDKSLWGEIF
ncbi:MAG: AAA family ATPase [Cyanobacteria bacterium P01_A01_bin.80]